jgi:hypothetical protein
MRKIVLGGSSKSYMDKAVRALADGQFVQYLDKNDRVIGTRKIGNANAAIKKAASDNEYFKSNGVVGQDQKEKQKKIFNAIVVAKKILASDLQKLESLLEVIGDEDTEAMLVPLNTKVIYTLTNIVDTLEGKIE